jgi:hypothetical protein
MRLSIRISKYDDKYNASLWTAKDSVSQSGEELFRTVAPLTKDKLIEVLDLLGFNRRDIFDSFDQAEGKSVDIGHPLFSKHSEKGDGGNKK